MAQAQPIHHHAPISIFTIEDDWQPDNWQQYATEREDTAQEVIERHRGEHESLLKLLAKEKRKNAALEAQIAAARFEKSQKLAPTYDHLVDLWISETGTNPESNDEGFMWFCRGFEAIGEDAIEIFQTPAAAPTDPAILAAWTSRVRKDGSTFDAEAFVTGYRAGKDDALTSKKSSKKPSKIVN